MKVASLAAKRCPRYAGGDEPALPTHEDQRLRAHVRACRRARRGQPWPGVPRFRLARPNPRRGGTRGEGRLQPISAVAWDHAAARGGSSALWPALRPAAERGSGLRDQRRDRSARRGDPGDRRAGRRDDHLHARLRQLCADDPQRGRNPGRGRAEAAGLAHRTGGDRGGGDPANPRDPAQQPAQPGRPAVQPRRARGGGGGRPRARPDRDRRRGVGAYRARRCDVHPVRDACGNGRADHQDCIGRQDLLADRVEGRVDGRRGRACAAGRPRAPVPDLLDRAQFAGGGRLRARQGRCVAPADARPVRARATG